VSAVYRETGAPGEDGGADGRPTILILVDYYLPGMKAGGPVRSVEHLVRRLGHRYRFRLIAGDRDLGDRRPYPEVPPGRWRRAGVAEAWYLAGGTKALGALRRVIRETPHDLLYLNSLFSPRMTFAVLLLRRLRAIPDRPVVLAPRGELHPGALATGGWRASGPGTALVTNPRYLKKRLYIRVCRSLGLFRGVVWQASTPSEAEHIRRYLGADARVMSARDLAGPLQGPPPERAPKEPGLLRVAYLSRISPKKNLEGAIALLAGVRGRVDFDIYGPVEEPGYWQQCRRALEALPPNVHARYHGMVPHEGVGEVLRAHDLLLLPTWGENYGHVVLEALVEGCPVLISDQTPWRDLERAGVGWDLPLTNPAAFRAVLERCVAMDPAEHAELCRRAVEYGRRCSEDQEAVHATRDLFDFALASFVPAPAEPSAALRAAPAVDAAPHAPADRR